MQNIRHNYVIDNQESYNNIYIVVLLKICGDREELES